MEKKCAVLFSGGLDSSLAVCNMIERGFEVELLHFDQGTLISNNLPEIRYSEFLLAYSNCPIRLHKLNASGVFRKIALTTLEEDILTHKASLICLGCKLAMHVQTIIFCKSNGITVIADGCTERQQRYGEQRETAIKFVRNLYMEHKIEYITPVYNYNEKEVKYGLFDRGITIQALEDTCMFSNTFSIASDEAIEKYLNSKYSLCKSLIERGMLYEKNR